MNPNYEICEMELWIWNSGYPFLDIKFWTYIPGLKKPRRIFGIQRKPGIPRTRNSLVAITSYVRKLTMEFVVYEYTLDLYNCQCTTWMVDSFGVGQRRRTKD